MINYSEGFKLSCVATFISCLLLEIHFIKIHVITVLKVICGKLHLNIKSTPKAVIATVRQSDKGDSSRQCFQRVR